MKNRNVRGGVSIEKETQWSTPVVIVHVEKGEAHCRQKRFEHDFTLGRANYCDIQFNDHHVSSSHAKVVLEGGRWFVQDLQSTNGTYLNGVRIQKVALPPSATIKLARDGPAITLEVERQPEAMAAEVPSERVSLTQIALRYFGTVVPGKIGEQTMLIRQAFQKVRRKHTQRYWTIISVILILLLGTIGALYYQSERLKKMHALAEDIFYAMKSLELQIATLQSAVAQRGEPELQKQVAEKVQQQRELQNSYSKFASELGISQEKLSKENWLIYKIARLFGECDVSMPDDFMKMVREYIQKWRLSSRLQEAIARAKANGYSAKIAQEMLANDLPPQFFYLALQESDFDVRRCGPPTSYGIAKGMWQFIPTTAVEYGLRTGPLVELARPDPRDDRHDFEKSTHAAAKYLRDIYETEAQASGLLVIASYNWGQSNILALIRHMPKNPRERNFWRLLAYKQIPQQTYDYVFYIISAAVIGENPRLFGFDFDSPLKLD
jgi:pSer/pThr/pTyr-binding forkhead associated (FHA) protein/soluble lytic murein transglycosylase-like protein